MEKNADILNELKEISPMVAGVGKANVFAVPQGYFDSVAYTVLACINNEMPSATNVPADYLDALTDTILSKIEGTIANELIGISPLIAGIKKVNPFKVPAYYFDQAPANIALQIEDENTPSILLGVNGVQSFTVPAGYFEQLAKTILQKVKEESGAKIIAMPKRRTSVFKYAAAAVFTGMVMFGLYKFSSNAPAVVTETSIAKVPVEKMDDTKFEEKLNSLNEDDIVKYLEKNGSETDVAALASGIDENSLPSQEEYFTDDATLDKFLDDINTKN